MASLTTLRLQQIEMRNSKCHGDFVDRDNRRITFPALKVAQILLGEAGSLGELLLRQLGRLADSGAILADQFPHIHAGNHWRARALWFIYYSMYSAIASDHAPEELEEPIAVVLADGSYAALDTQRVGRMGELIVEFELLKRGWIVGNFNSTTMNSVGWDLFATKDNRSVKIRVKAKRPGVSNFRWAAKRDGKVFVGGDESSDDDFVAAVSFEADGTYQTYVLPAQEVEAALAAEHAAWIGGTKASGGARKDTPMRSIYIDDRDDGAPAHGFRTRWAAYCNAWTTLEKN